jgi:hypothetical protein
MKQTPALLFFCSLHLTGAVSEGAMYKSYNEQSHVALPQPLFLSPFSLLDFFRIVVTQYCSTPRPASFDHSFVCTCMPTLIQHQTSTQGNECENDCQDKDGWKVKAKDSLALILKWREMKSLFISLSLSPTPSFSLTLSLPLLPFPYLLPVTSVRPHKLVA